MALLVDVLGRYPLPTVRAIVSGVPAGTAWELHGTSADGEWLVASGVSTGGEVVTADPWAPLGVPTSYRLTFGATVQTDGPVVRRFGGDAAITDLTGRTVADVAWMASGDERESERRAHFSQVPGARFSPARLDPIAGAGGGAVTVRAGRPDADTFAALLATNKPLILLHNRDRCRIPGCVVEPVRTVWFTADQNRVVPIVSHGVREWSLPYRLMPSGVRDGVVPVVDNRDVLDHFESWADVLATVGGDLAALPRGDWFFQ